MREPMLFRSLVLHDLFKIESQPSQRVQVGLSAEMTYDVAVLLSTQPVAWTAWRGSVPVACFGIVEQFPRRHGLGWSILAEGIGRDMLKLTRFIAHEIATCGLARVELLAKAQDIEPMLARMDPLDPGQIVAVAMLKPTKAMRWAMLLGMQPGHLLRCYGAMSESYMMFERITPPQLGALRLVERAA